MSACVCTLRAGHFPNVLLYTCIYSICECVPPSLAAAAVCIKSVERRMLLSTLPSASSVRCEPRNGLAICWPYILHGHIRVRALNRQNAAGNNLHVYVLRVFFIVWGCSTQKHTEQQAFRSPVCDAYIRLCTSGTNHKPKWPGISHLNSRSYHNPHTHTNIFVLYICSASLDVYLPRKHSLVYNTTSTRVHS